VLLDLGFGRLVIRIWAVETNASSRPGIVEVGAEDIPPLAEVQDAVMALSGPALRGDADPVCFGHACSSKSLTGPVSMGLRVL